jgi:hypothetical protein
MAENPSRSDRKPVEHRLWVFGRPWTRWRTARLVLLLSWFVAVFFWALNSQPAALWVVRGLTWVIVPVLLWPWIRGPYLLYSRHSLPLQANYTVQDQADGTFDFARHDENMLHDLGFERSGCIVARAALPSRKVMAVIYVHSGNMDTAYLGQVQTRLGPMLVCAFMSRFTDDFVLESSSARTQELVPPDPNHPVFRFPQLRSRRGLYRIHQELKKRLAATRTPKVGDKAEELGRFIARAEKAHERIAKTYCKLSKEGDRYVPTMRGAIRLAWLFTWPIKDIRQLRAEGKAMKTAEELGLPINPKFGCLVESVSATQRQNTYL